MQKALDQMNVQVHHVLSDLTGVNALRILDAITAGNTIQSDSPRCVTGE